MEHGILLILKKPIEKKKCFCNFAIDDTNIMLLL